jgi:hypothetical protein
VNNHLCFKQHSRQSLRGLWYSRGYSIIEFVFAGAGSFTTTHVTLHSRTNMEVISLFLRVTFDVQKTDTHTAVVGKKTSSSSN